jgi:hypothetical protein
VTVLGLVPEWVPTAVLAPPELAPELAAALVHSPTVVAVVVDFLDE